MIKATRYEWAKPGDKGRMSSVPVADLKIDHSYQRQELSDTHIIAIARDFRWSAFNTLTVMERANGDKFVVDGQQRLAAAKRREDISHVPCIVFQSDGKEHEAQAFLALNTKRAKVSARDKFQAADRANIEPERSIANWLRSVGLHVTADGKSPTGVCFPHVLIRSWMKDQDTCKRAIDTQRQINGSEPLVSKLHLAIFYLDRNGISVADEVQKIVAAGGRTAVLGGIRAIQIDTGLNDTDRVCALGMLKVINHRRHRKIKLPGQDEEVQS